ncbi:MAG: hypothetical protein KY450_12810, partial [Actinobacteria bacterium]|nr:hypothetical protein [Actinomycetota bacterium]
MPVKVEGKPASGIRRAAQVVRTSGDVRDDTSSSSALPTLVTVTVTSGHVPAEVGKPTTRGGSAMMLGSHRRYKGALMKKIVAMVAVLGLVSGACSGEDDPAERAD